PCRSAWDTESNDPPPGSLTPRPGLCREAVGLRSPGSRPRLAIAIPWGLHEERALLWPTPSGKLARAGATFSSGKRAPASLLQDDPVHRLAPHDDLGPQTGSQREVERRVRDAGDGPEAALAARARLAPRLQAFEHRLGMAMQAGIV